MSTPHTPSPTGSVIGPLESGIKNTTFSDPKSESIPPSREVFNVENEKEQPTKEENETNQKNLQQSASFLGQLIFKLR